MTKKTNTKSMGTRLQRMEDELKVLKNNSKMDVKTIENLINHLTKISQNLLRVDIINVCLSNIIIKKKLTTRKKLDKMCNDERKKILEKMKKKREEILKVSKEKIKEEKNDEKKD